jgi:hypothetical protein
MAVSKVVLPSGCRRKRWATAAYHDGQRPNMAQPTLFILGAAAKTRHDGPLFPLS